MKRITKNLCILRLIDLQMEALPQQAMKVYGCQ